VSPVTAGGLGRYLDNFFLGALTGEFGVKELVLDTFFLSGVYRLMLVGIGRGDSIADSGL